MRHIFQRCYLRNHTLVAVTARHFVAGLKLALHGNENLDHLHYARRKFVAALKFFDLVVEAILETLFAFRKLLA